MTETKGETMKELEAVSRLIGFSKAMWGDQLDALSVSLGNCIVDVPGMTEDTKANLTAIQVLVDQAREKVDEL